MLSVLLVILLVPLLWGQISAQAARSWLLDVNYAKESIRKSGLYNQAGALIGDLIAAKLSQPGAPLPITAADVAPLINRLLPPVQIQTFIETALDGLHQWFVSGSDHPVIVLHLSTLRANLTPAVREALQAKVEALPVCTPAQVLELVRKPPAGLPPCKSPDAQLNRAILEQLVPADRITKMLPETLDVSALLEGQNGPRYWSDLNQKAAPARKALALIPWGWAIVGLFLLLLVLLNLDRWYTPLGWCGTTLLLGAGLLRIASFVMAHTGLQMMMQQMRGGDVGAELGATLMKSVANSFLSSVDRLSLPIFLVGVAAVMLAIVLRILRRRSPDFDARIAS